MSEPLVVVAPSSMHQRLKRFEAASSALISEVSLDGVLNRVAHVAAEVTDAPFGAIALLGSDGVGLEHFTTYGIDPELRVNIGAPPRGHGILGLVVREARAIRLSDASTHPDFRGFPPHHPPMQAFLGVP